jgi:hypothetical protein
MDEQTDASNEFDALQRVITALQAVDQDARRRIVDAAAMFLQLDVVRRTGTTQDTARSDPHSGPSYPAFSSDHSMSPKEFLFLKQPRSDVERIAVLAYYLTHYRETPHFKTLDLSKLNTEAAQPKFSNAANSANNAVKRGYLVPTTKGQRQLSAAGERFVDALPDHDAARQAMAAAQVRRRVRRSPTKAASGGSDRAG